MASYSVQVSINKSSFPEIGNPLYPKQAKEVKPQKADREAYTGYTSSVGMSASTIVSGFRNQPANTGCDFDNLLATFDFERDTPKTYKFLGMDIDDNFNAVIKMGSGCVIVAPMYDRDVIEKLFTSYSRYLDDVDASVLQNLTKESVRTVATAMKTGVVYDIHSKMGTYGGNTANYEDLDILRDIIKKDIDRSSNKESGRLEFDSILLNLVHAKKAEQVSTASSSGSESIVGLVLQSVMGYWSTVIKRYNSYYSILSTLDLWSDANRRIIGSSEFNSRMAKCINITDNATGTPVDGMVSFSGIAKNGSVSDDNVIRSAAHDALLTLSATASNSYTSSRYDSMDLLISMIDPSGIDDVYSLEGAEVQAMSVLDSLAYVDDDADLCRESYDMNDPEQRGLFVKSTIRSYERNFREFKPATNYDVTDALANMVERGDIVDRPPVTVADATDDTVADIVTGTKEDISVNVNKQQLLKVMKLVNKSIERVLKDF